MTLLVLIVASLVWPRGDENSNQSNDIDSSKTQIKIIVKRINIRKEASISSEDIGDVYDGEIFTVLEYVSDDEYYWYKIETSTGITGYIASDKNGEYVEFISGYIDRLAPEIVLDSETLIFVNGKEDYTSVTCIDEYSGCALSYKKVDNMYIEISATDEAGNINTKTVKFYDVYNSYNKFYESNKNFGVTYTKSLKNNKLVLTATYTLNKQIPSKDKSISYSTLVVLYDEDFNILNNLDGKYNASQINSTCINDERMLLKENYLESNLSVTDKICFNYTLNDASKVKYFEIAIQGVENYDSANNYLSNYSSRTYIIE